MNLEFLWSTLQVNLPLKNTITIAIIIINIKFEIWCKGNIQMQHEEMYFLDFHSLCWTKWTISRVYFLHF